MGGGVSSALFLARLLAYPLTPTLARLRFLASETLLRRRIQVVGMRVRAGV